MASCGALMTIPEFIATDRSSPVATIGGSATRSGTACRCMLEPISARLASSCSRNGIRPADTPTICFGEMSWNWTCSVGIVWKSVSYRAMTVGPLSFPASSTGASAGARYASDSSSARIQTTLSVRSPSVICRYGVTRKPYSSTPP